LRLSKHGTQTWFPQHRKCIVVPANLLHCGQVNCPTAHFAHNSTALPTISMVDLVTCRVSDPWLFPPDVIVHYWARKPTFGSNALLQ
jgi:hypothetical protein